MSDISSWSTVAASNNSVSPDGWPEGMAPNGVNNSARENMAAIRTHYDDTEWRNWGHTVAQASATTFTIAGVDVTAIYPVGRRLRIVDATTVYATVTVVAVDGTPDTTVTVVVDNNTALTATMDGINVSVGQIPTNNPQFIENKGSDIASANDLALGATGRSFDITGTTTINGISSRAAGTTIVLEFDGALLLKNNTAPSAGYEAITLPGSLDITTAAGDIIELIAEGDGSNWRTLYYTKASRVGEIKAVVKTADNAAVNNSVSLVNDTHLVLSNITTGYYDLELFLYVTTNSTADFRVAFSTTGTIADDWFEAVVYSDADTSTHYHVKTDISTNTALSGCGTNNSITIKGTLNVTVTGNLQFRYAQGTAAVVDTITKKGSFMKLTKVS